MKVGDELICWRNNTLGYSWYKGEVVKISKIGNENSKIFVECYYYSPTRRAYIGKFILSYEVLPFFMRARVFNGIVLRTLRGNNVACAKTLSEVK